ncbi:helix-turn-helix domain-containing protein [Flavobacterium johnsoniae]|uniref:helix-turn-helix domain-containing protein n=1 Tax=Flavobacterium johnsoniae TaxID=986 RepID=UPI003D970270
MATETNLVGYKIAFGKNLRKLREERIRTLSGVDRKTRFDSSNYHKYEIGIGNPTLETIIRIASALEIHPKELLNFEFELNIDELHK